MLQKICFHFSTKYEELQKLTRRSTLFKANYVPLALISTSFAAFIAWSKLPYGQAFPHLTISEYLPKKQYFHSILLAPLNFQTNGHLLVYGPVMAYTFYQMSTILSNTQFLSLYILNSVICSAFTVYYERKRNNEFNINLMSPKCISAITPLSFMSSLMVLNPKLQLLKRPPIPFFLIPAFFAMYEFQEYQNGYINEICRPAHLLSMINGLLLGIVFKRFV